MDGARRKRPIFMIIRESNVEPCKTSWLCVEVRVEVCGSSWALLIGHHACMNEHVIGRRVIGARLAFSFRFVCVCEREKRGRAVARPSPLSPSKAPAGRNCPTLSSFFFSLSAPPHVKFINVFCVIFFPSFAPQSRLRSGFLDQLYRYIYTFFFFFSLRMNWPRQIYKDRLPEQCALVLTREGQNTAFKKEALVCCRVIYGNLAAMKQTFRFLLVLKFQTSLPTQINTAVCVHLTNFR